MFQYDNVSLHTFGYQLPPNILRSEDIEKRLHSLYEKLKLPAGRLELMSGIKERRLWNEGTLPSQAAIMAGKDTMEKADIKPEQVECLFFTSVSRDMMEPATASFVHNGLGLSKDCLIFDISNACLGFLDGMMMLANMIELGQVDNGLVVSGETAENLVESTLMTLLNDKKLTRKSIKPAFASLTIGSGAVGLYMTRKKEEVNKPALVCGAYRANTQYSNLCQGGQTGGEQTLMDTNSEELLMQGVDTAYETWRKFSSLQGWTDADIDNYFCHQVGSAHAKLLFDRLNLSSQKNFQTLEFLGNVGSVSAPITLAMALEQKVFIPGRKGALLGIGSGINCMMLGVEWKK